MAPYKEVLVKQKTNTLNLGCPAMAYSSSKCKTTPTSNSLNIEIEECFDKPKVSEYYYYFTHIAFEKLPPCSGRFGKLKLIFFYHKQNVSENIVGLVSVTVEEISSILNSISASKATCLDGFNARFIKDGSFVIAKPLTLQTYLQLLEISLMI